MLYLYFSNPVNLRDDDDDDVVVPFLLCHQKMDDNNIISRVIFKINKGHKNEFLSHSKEKSDFSRSKQEDKINELYYVVTTSY